MLMRLGADVYSRVSSVTIVTGRCSGIIETLRHFQNIVNGSIVHQDTQSTIIGIYFPGVKLAGA